MSPSQSILSGQNRANTQIQQVSAQTQSSCASCTARSISTVRAQSQSRRKHVCTDHIREHSLHDCMLCHKRPDAFHLARFEHFPQLARDQLHHTIRPVCTTNVIWYGHNTSAHPQQQQHSRWDAITVSSSVGDSNGRRKCRCDSSLSARRCASTQRT